MRKAEVICGVTLAVLLATSTAQAGGWLRRAKTPAVSKKPNIFVRAHTKFKAGGGWRTVGKTLKHYGKESIYIGKGTAFTMAIAVPLLAACIYHGLGGPELSTLAALKHTLYSATGGAVGGFLLGTGANAALHQHGVFTQQEHPHPARAK